MSDTRYRGASRFGLDDNSEIEAMEAARDAANMAQPGDPDPITAEEILDDPTLKQAPANAEEDTFKKRYADLRRHSQATENSLKQEIADIKRQLKASTKQELKLPASETDLEAWMQEFPDVARIVESIAIKRAKEVMAEADERVKRLEERETKTAKELAMAKLLKRHPDLNEIQADPAFHQWVKSKSRTTQFMVYESDSWEDCADALDAYKDYLKASAPPPEKRGPGRPPKEVAQEASMAIRTQSDRPQITTTDGKRRYRESELKKMDWRDFEKLEDDIEEARRDGRLILDLTGGSM